MKESVTRNVITTGNPNIYLQAICDLLVAAGYFRARISGLTAFDKVKKKKNSGFKI